MRTGRGSSMSTSEQMHALLSLVQWLSPAFPTGAFAYSHGLEQAIAAAVAKGAKRMLLEVRAGNASAIGLYEGLGFRQIGRRRDYYPAKRGREDALIYDKELAWA